MPSAATWRAWAFAVTVSVLAGCATAPGRGPLASEGGPPAAARQPIQVLLRAKVEDGARSGNLRLTLRLWRADRFELRASDPLGRQLWTLAVAEERGYWLDERAGARCRFAAGDRARIGEVTLPLPSRLLPVVLLGELPATPPEGWDAAAGAARSVQFEDAEARSWRVSFADGGRMASWRLDGRDGEALEWHRRGDRQRLTSTTPRLAIEWREVTREALVVSEPAWDGGAERAPECGDEDLP